MNKDYLKRKVRSRIKKVLLQERSPLQYKHFPGYGAATDTRESGNLVVKAAEDKGKLSDFWIETDAFVYRLVGNEPGNPSHWKPAKEPGWERARIPAGTQVTLASTEWKDVKTGTDRPAAGQTIGYAKISFPDPSDPQKNASGYVGVPKLETNISQKKSQGILAPQKVGKSAEYALAQAMNGGPPNYDASMADSQDPNKGGDKTVTSAYQGATSIQRLQFEKMFEMLHDAANKAVSGLQNVTFSNASVPLDPNALVDVTATLARGGVDRNADVHVKYNDPKRKFGLQPGAKLDSEKGQILVRKETEGGHEIILQQNTEGGESVEEVATSTLQGLNNLSSVMWKQVRESMWKDYIPSDIRTKVVKGTWTDGKDTDFIMTPTPHPKTQEWWNST